MSRRPGNSSSNNNNNMMMMMNNNNNNKNNTSGNNLDANDLGGATLGSTQYQICMTQEETAKLFGSAGVLGASPMMYGTPQFQLSQGGGQQLSQQDNGGAMQQQQQKRRIVKEPTIENVDILKQAISKINKDNAWNTPLPAAHLDHVSRLMASDDAGGINGASVDHFKQFTKYATLVEQSTKVWAHRVDSTHMLSNQMLNRLRRNDAAGADGDGAGGDGAGGEGSPAGGKKKKNKNRALQKTIVDSEKEINIDGFDLENAGQKGLRVTYGAMFAAMTQKFDQGFKGLLLNNAPIGREGNPYLDRDFARPEYQQLYNNIDQQQQQQGGSGGIGGGSDESGGIRISGVLLKSLKNTAEDGSPKRLSQHSHSSASPQKLNNNNNRADDDEGLPPLSSDNDNNNNNTIDDFSNIVNNDDDNVEDNFDEGYENYGGGNNNDDEPDPTASGEESGGRKSRFSSSNNNINNNSSLALHANNQLSRAGSVANQLSRAQSVANESLQQLQQDAYQNQNSMNIADEANYLATGFYGKSGQNKHHAGDDDDDANDYGDNDFGGGGFDDDDDMMNMNNNNNQGGPSSSSVDDDGFALPVMGNNNNNKNQKVSALAAEDGTWQPLNQSSSAGHNNNKQDHQNNPAFMRFNNPAGGNAVLKTIRQGTKIGNSTEAILAGIDEVTLSKKKGGRNNAAMMKNNNTNQDDDDNEDEEDNLLMMLGSNNKNKGAGSSKSTGANANNGNNKSSLNLDDLRNFDVAFKNKLKAAKIGQNLIESLPTPEKLSKEYTRSSFTKERAIEKKLLLARATTPEQNQLAWWLPRLASRDVTCYYQPFCAPEASSWNLLAKYSSSGGDANNNNQQGGGGDTFGQTGDDFGGGDYDDFGGYDGDDDDVQQDEQLADGLLLDNGDEYDIDLDVGDEGDFVSAQELLNSDQQQLNQDGEASGGSGRNSAGANSELLKLIEPPASIDLGQFVIPAALVQINVVALRSIMWQQLKLLADINATTEYWQTILQHKDIQNDLRRDAAELAARGDPKALAAIKEAEARRDEDEDNQTFVVPGKNAAGKRVAPITSSVKSNNNAVFPDPEPNRPACIFSEVVLSMLPYHKKFVTGGSLAPAFYFFSLLFLANDKGLLMVPLQLQAKEQKGSTHCEDVLILLPPHTDGDLANLKREQQELRNKRAAAIRQKQQQ